jgi:hypothetical protein
MPATDRSFRFPRAIAIMVPLLAALGGCVAAPLLQLAATPLASQGAPCTVGASTAGCSTGATGSMIPGMGSLMQVLAPSAPAPH